MYRRRPINRTELPDQIRLVPGTQPSNWSGRVRRIRNIAPPLSLQDLCLFRLINDMDSYPVELLSSLPHWLRYLLLSNLPVLDLCQLDHTPVARGVDIDKIWTARVEGEPEIKPSFLSWGLGITRCVYIESMFQMHIYRRYGSKFDKTIVELVQKEMKTVFQHQQDKKKFMNDKEEVPCKTNSSCSVVFRY